MPQLAMLAAPMNVLLKKLPEGDPRSKVGTPEHAAMMDGVQQSFRAILMFLQSCCGARVASSAQDSDSSHHIWRSG